jgi:hypothetical protein
MRTIDDEIDDIAKKLDALSGLLDDVDKAADDGVTEAGDDTAETAAELAEVRAEVDALEKTLKDAIAAHDTTFERATAAIAKRDGCSKLMAMTRARLEYPADFRRYVEGGVRIAKDAGAEARRSNITVGETRGHALRDFNDIVMQIMRTDNVTRTAALQKARTQYPAEFVAAYK